MPSFFSDYLSPANAFALAIVICLICFFIVWIVGLILYWIRLREKNEQIENNQDIQPLVTARQERDDNGTKTDANPVFQDFCMERSLSENSFISNHLKAIFLAGWNESRLEVSELINHTTSNLFRWNSLLRSILAVFIVIGLLGTLFGLTDSLVDLSPALRTSAERQSPIESGETNNPIDTNTGDSRQMTNALSDLMDDIKGAFAPSIVGVFFTILGVILYGIFLRSACHPVKSTLEQSTLTIWVPKLYPTTSQKLVQTLQKSESQMQKGLETAAQFSESVQKVHGNIDEFNQSLTQASAITAPLSDSVSQINSAASDISVAANVLNTGFTESLDKFSKDFASSVNQLTGFQDEIRNLHEQFQKEENQKLNQFQDATNQKLDLQTDKLDDQNNNIALVNKAIDQTLNALKNYETTYINSQKEISSELQEFINKATQTNTSIYAENREWFEKINNANKQQFSDMQIQLKTELANVQQTLNDQLGSLGSDLGTNLSDLQNSLNDRLDTLNDRLENFDTPLKDAVNNIKESFDIQLDTLNNCLDNFDKPLQEAADQMRDTYADLVRYIQNIIGDLQKKIIEINNKYGDQLTTVKDLNTSLVDLLNQLNQSSTNQKSAVDVLSNNVNDLTVDTQKLTDTIITYASDTGDLSQSVRAIKEIIGELGDASQQFVEKVDNADVTPLTESIDKLNTSINDISQHSETLVNSVDRLARQVKSDSDWKPKRKIISKLRSKLSRKKTSKLNDLDSQSQNE